MKRKNFDCLTIKHRGAKRIYEETKDLTLKQELEYWQRKSKEMMRRQGKRMGTGSSELDIGHSN